MNKRSSDMGIIDTAEYKSGNILSFAIVTMGVYLLANTVVVSGLLILGGGAHPHAPRQAIPLARPQHRRLGPRDRRCRNPPSVTTLQNGSGGVR